MNTVHVDFSVNQPEVEDYNKSFPKMPINTPQKERIFMMVTEPRNILSALIVAEATGASPVAYYEKVIQHNIDIGRLKKLDNHEKQFVGTSTCVVMEANGWIKTGRKQRYSKGIFSAAEIYEKLPQQK